MTPTEQQLALTVEEAARRLGLSRSTTYAAIRAGEIPAFRIRGRLLVPIKALETVVSGTAHTPMSAGGSHE